MRILYALAYDEESVITEQCYYRKTFDEIKTKQVQVIENDDEAARIFKVTIEEVPE